MDAENQLVIDMNVFVEEPLGWLTLKDGTRHAIRDSLDVSNKEQAALIKMEISLRVDTLSGPDRLQKMQDMLKIFVPTVTEEQWLNEFSPKRITYFVKQLRDHTSKLIADQVEANKDEVDPPEATSSQSS